MKLFISWSGERSRLVAEALRSNLADVLQGLSVFMSRADIESGVRWSQSIASELDQSDYGVLCLTSESLASPWLVFEAGALSKRMGSRACGLLIGNLAADDITGPLSQFQHRPFSKNEVKRLLQDINESQDRPLKQAQLDRIFPKHWPDLLQAYEQAIAAPIDTATEPPSIEEVYTEIKALNVRLARGGVDSCGFARKDEPSRYENLLLCLRMGLKPRTLGGWASQGRAYVADRALAYGLRYEALCDLIESCDIGISEESESS